MAKTRRAYTGGAVETTTQSDINASGTTSFTVQAATGWPYGTDPYYVVVSPGTASEEKILVTRASSSTTTISIASESRRGQDGTSAVSHGTGATVYPVFTAVDADEANELTSMYEAKGDIISHGTSTFSRLAVGTNDYVLQADSSAASGLAWGQVATAGIANDAVTAAKIAAGAVDTAELAADAVTNAKIANDSIDSEHYVDGSIDTAHLAADAVDGTKIADNSINSEHYVDGSIDRVHLAADIVNGTKIADNSINSEHYVDGSIDTAHIGDDQVTGAKIAHNTITATHINANAVGSSELADDAVDTAAIADDAVTSAKIADDAVGSAQIANNAVALGTQTTGNYVADVNGGDGIDVTGADAEGATKTVAVDSTVLRGEAGGSTTAYTVDENGYITVTTGVTSGNIIAAFASTSSQTTSSSEYVLAIPVTNINNSVSPRQFTCRVYEINGSGNGDHTVSTIYTSGTITVPLTWLVLTD